MMTFHKAKSLMKQCWVFYLFTLAIVFGIKYFYSKADSSDLNWMLAPTAWWASILSGIPFYQEPHVGYVNHSIRFIIAASCSGIQFMNIAIATLVFSYVHRMGTGARKAGWLALSLGGAYLLAILANGLRILLSIYLPMHLPALLQRFGGLGSWLTPGRLHSITGICVYFTALVLAYHLGGHISGKFSDWEGRGAKNLEGQTRRYFPPAFWYFSMALGVPFLNRAYEGNQRGFMEYALLIFAVCLTLVFLFSLANMAKRHLVHGLKTIYSQDNRGRTGS